MRSSNSRRRCKSFLYDIVDKSLVPVRTFRDNGEAWGRHGRVRCLLKEQH